ncbi:MAG: serine/threonine-protein kinase RsbW [Baekduia sp.]|nr:serine/threonine-protein kinase RsbW [Baekduia sp.]
MDAPDTLTIASRFECIDEARRWVAERVRSAGYGDDPVGEIELALTEALANVIEHGYGGDGSGEIAVTVVAGGDSLAVRVRDWGHGADEVGFERRDLDDPGEGGYGVYMMEQLMDDVTREAQPDGGTLLTMIKRKKEGHHG